MISDNILARVISDGLYGGGIRNWVRVITRRGGARLVVIKRNLFHTTVSNFLLSSMRYRAPANEELQYPRNSLHARIGMGFHPPTESGIPVFDKRPLHRLTAHAKKAGCTHGAKRTYQLSPELPITLHKLNTQSTIITITTAPTTNHHHHRHHQHHHQLIHPKSPD